MTDQTNEDAQVTQPDGPAITFAYLDEEGNEVECRALYFFHADHNDKDYMVYTTGVVGDEGEEVSAARIDARALEAVMKGEVADLQLEPLTEEVEWAIVADTLRRVTEGEAEVDSSDVLSEEADIQAVPEN